MAASLLIMVCEITSRKKKLENTRPELQKAKADLEKLRDELIMLSLEDASAYDLVMGAVKARRDDPGEPTEKEYQSALRHASEVPQETALACMKVLELSLKVASIGTKSAASDVAVAALLADASLRGAAMNVRINLFDLSDRAFAEAAKGKLDTQARQASGLTKKVLTQLSRGDF